MKTHKRKLEIGTESSSLPGSVGPGEVRAEEASKGREISPRARTKKVRSSKEKCTQSRMRKEDSLLRVGRDGEDLGVELSELIERSVEGENPR